MLEFQLPSGFMDAEPPYWYYPVRQSLGAALYRAGIGQPVHRKEDQRLLTGTGRFVDDRNLPGQTHAVVLRSPHRAACRLVP